MMATLLAAVVGFSGCGGVSNIGTQVCLFVKRDHCTALWAVQHPSMTPTGFVCL